MDRMIVVVFDSEAKAYEGRSVLKRLDGEGSLTLFECAVVQKNADGSTFTVKQDDDDGPLGTLAGTSLGSLIGILGGPAGVVVGATAGLFTGLIADLHNSRVGDDFIADVAKALRPGKVAVVAEVEEDRTTPVDARMEAIGGLVFRRSLSEAKEIAHQDEVDAIKADIAQMKAERAALQADRRKRFDEKISQLEAKLQAGLERAKERRLAADGEAKAKADALKAKAARARAST